MSSQQQLVDIVTNTQKDLITVWNTLGLTEQEQEAGLKDILQLVENTFRDHRSQTEAYLAELNQKAAQLRTDIVQLGAVLDEKRVVEDELKSVRPSPLLPLIADLTNINQVLTEKKNARLSLLEEYQRKMTVIYDEIQREMPLELKHIGASISAARVTDFEARLRALEQEKVDRSRQVAFLATNIHSHWQTLGIDPSTLVNDIDKRIIMREAQENVIGISDSVIKFLKQRQEELEQMELKRKAAVHELSVAILALWNLLEVTQDERKAFSATVKENPLSNGTIDKYRAELDRLRQLKGGKLHELIQKEAERLQSLWEEMRWGPQQRNNCEQEILARARLRRSDSSQSDTKGDWTTTKLSTTTLSSTLRAKEGQDTDFLDAIFAECCRMHEALSQKLHLCEPILAVVRKREEMRREIQAFEESEEASSLESQFGRKGFEVLKQRERVENLKKKALPKLDAKLQGMIAAWEEKQQEPFQVDGVAYSDTIHFEQEQDRAKEEAKKPKKPEPVAASPAVRPSTAHALGRPSTLNSVSLDRSARPSVAPKRATPLPASAVAVPASGRQRSNSSENESSTANSAVKQMLPPAPRSEKVNRSVSRTATPSKRPDKKDSSMTLLRTRGALAMKDIEQEASQLKGESKQERKTKHDSKGRSDSDSSRKHEGLWSEQDESEVMMLQSEEEVKRQFSRFSPDIIKMIVEASQRIGAEKYQEAERIYTAMIDSVPSDHDHVWWLFMQRARLHRKMSDMEAALADSQRAMAAVQAKEEEEAVRV